MTNLAADVRRTRAARPQGGARVKLELARRPAGARAVRLAVAPWRAPALILAVGLLAVSCTSHATEAKPTEPATAPRLVLEVTPDRGQAPMHVQLAARLVGDVGTSPEGRCPSIAWIMGNGDVVIARPADCGGEMPRRYESEYTYRVAGAYNVYVRLLAAAVTPSSPRQVLVLGATPTPAAPVAVPGPTIVLATPGRRPARVAQAPTAREAVPPTPLPTSGRGNVPPGAGVATPPAGPPSPTKGALSAGETPGAPLSLAPAPTGAATGAPSSAPGGLSQAAVLPAHLYYVALADRRLYRLPADGGVPEPLSPVGQAVGDYDVAANGAIAYVGDGHLWLRLPGSEPFRVADRASRPVWSRDGRDLAYASEGVWRYRVADGRRESVAADGVPLAWSRSGTALVTRRANGALEVIGPEPATRLAVPVKGVDEAGWFADREMFWTSGAGLRLVSLGRQVQLATLVEAEATRSVFVRPDGTLLALVASAEGWQPVAIGLTAALPTMTVIGAALPAADGTSFLWSPDGRHAVCAGLDGIQLMDPASGTRVPLLEAAAERPLWRLGWVAGAR